MWLGASFRYKFVTKGSPFGSLVIELLILRGILILDLGLRNII